MSSNQDDNDEVTNPAKSGDSENTEELGTRKEETSIPGTSKEVESPVLHVKLKKGDEIKCRYAEVRDSLYSKMLKCNKVIAIERNISTISRYFQEVCECHDHLVSVHHDMKYSVTPDEMSVFDRELDTINAEMKQLSAEVKEELNRIREEERSLRSSSRCSRASRRSKGSIDSRASGYVSPNVQQANNVAKDAAVLKARLSFIEEEKTLQLDKTKMKFQEQKLELSKQIAEKVAIADACWKAEQLENPFGIDRDLIEQNMSEIRESIPVSTLTDKINLLSLHENNNIRPNELSLQVQTDANLTRSSTGNVENSVSFVVPALNENNVNAPVITPQSSPSVDPVSNNSNNQNDIGLLQFAQSILNAQRLPDLEIWKFHGDAIHFPQWEASFDSLVEQRVKNTFEKMNLLRQYLGEGPRKVINGYFLLNTEDSYQKARSELKHRYGGKSVIATAFLNKLKSWPIISSNIAHSLREFSDFLQQVRETKKVVHELDSLDFSSNLKQVVEILPGFAIEAWRKNVFSYKKEKNDPESYPPFVNFVDFVKDQSEMKNMPEFDGINFKRKTETKFSDKKPVAPIFKSVKTSHSFSTNTKTGDCIFCQSEHHVSVCDKLAKEPYAKRKSVFRKNYLCYGCGDKMTGGHRAKICKAKATCATCGKLHLTCLHIEKETVKHGSMCVDVCSELDQSEGTDHTMIVPVWIRAKSNPNKRVLRYCVLDSQSNASFIDCDTQKELGLIGHNTQINLSTMTGRKIVSCQKFENIEILNYNQDEVVCVPKIYSRKEIPVCRSQIPKKEVCKKWDHLKDVSEKLEPYLENTEVSILLGTNALKAIRPREIVVNADDDTQPYAVRTLLGWSVVGTVCKSANGNKRVTAHRTMVSDDDFKNESFVYTSNVKELINPQQVKSMFDLEFAEHKGKDAPLSVDDRKFIKILSDGIVKRKDGHYEMPLPLKNESALLPNNKPVAEKRLKQLKKQLLKDPKFKEDYVKFMNDVIEKWADVVPESELNIENGRVNYVPHMGVYHPKKPEKIRVVFDCSAVYGGVSLNDFLLQGPDLLNGMMGILCRFRKNYIALLTDVRAMFHQFFVSEPFRNLLRFFWWENSDIENGKLVEHRMKVHLFGAASSPGCANFGLKRAGDDGELKFGREAADFIRDNFYMDDGVTSKDEIEEVISLAKNSTGICADAGLILDKFMSNSHEVMESIPPEYRAKGMKGLDPKVDPLPIERVLGIVWCAENDKLHFRIELKIAPVTRRGILSSVISVYDPLGLVAPVILEGKRILQALCREGVKWDDPIPDVLRKRWLDWREEICEIETLQINRCFKPPDFGKVKSVEYHHFSDACENAYGQCSYVRLINENNKAACSLVVGKSRVAPLKHVTIPRLELSAAVVSARMSKFLRDELQYDCVTEYFWVDSMIVLGYIKNEAKRFHVYVANRVPTIHDHTNPDSWFHVPSASNPGDDASRGLHAKALTEDCRWLLGPDFLQCDGAFVPPVNKFVLDESVNIELKNEMRKGTVFQCDTTEKDLNNSLGKIEIERLDSCSTWYKAVKSAANCNKYMLKCLKRPCSDLNSDDLKSAENLIIRSLQAKHFENEITQLNLSKNVDIAIQRKPKTVRKNSQLYKLDPFLDEHGLLRVEGRIVNSYESYDVKHPVIIPKKSHLTELLVRHFHEKVNHMGRYTTLNAIRQNGYWVVNGSSVVSQVILKCVKCRKFRGNVQIQKMAALPPDRFSVEPPFTYSGCDVFGIYQIKEKRSILKRYCVLFTCMSSRAVHLESLNSMSTDSFINALRRFQARRGPIKQLRCDNGSNFVGAKNELQKSLQELDQNRIKEYLLEQNCDLFEFKFTISSGSHMSDFVERQIRTVKSALDPLLIQFGHMLSDESFRTFLCEVENIVNARPLSVDTMNDPTAPEPLTPNHILTMKPQVFLPPPGVFQKADKYLLRRWRRVQYLANEFWYRWKREYINSQQSKRKWNDVKQNIQIGDIVMICDEGQPRNAWKIDRVDNVFPSNDGFVRKVKLAVATKDLDKNGKRLRSVSYLERPIHKLVLLLANAQNK